MLISDTVTSYAPKCSLTRTTQLTFAPARRCKAKCIDHERRLSYRRCRRLQARSECALCLFVPFEGLSGTRNEFISLFSSQHSTLHFSFLNRDMSKNKGKQVAKAFTNAPVMLNAATGSANPAASLSALWTYIEPALDHIVKSPTNDPGGKAPSIDVGLYAGIHSACYN